MTMRKLIRIAVLAGLSFTAVSRAASRPNILFFLIDDMGYTDLSCFGGNRVQTPAIDRAAHEGERFTQFYVNSPICSPSRVAFTTGQYPLRWGITSYLDTRQIDKDRGIRDWLDPHAPTLARILHESGYYTAHVGKWHMGGQRDIGEAPLITEYGFDTSLTSFEGLGERILPKWDPKPDGTEVHHPPTDMNSKLGRGPIRWVPRYRETQEFVDRAIVEIENAKKADKPFYLNLWPDDVHSPCEAPPEERGNGSPVDNYLGVMKEMDKQFARLFEYVQSHEDLRDNTIILIASDNGPEAGLGTANGLRGSKGQLFEGGIHLPLIVWAPKLAAAGAAGSTNDHTVLAGMDFPPTILALTGVEKPAPIAFDGRDMSEVLLGKTSKDRDTAVMWVRPPDRPGPRGMLPDLAIRDGKWKLLVKRDGSVTMLFDISTDPGEKTNLAKENPDLVAKLTQRVKDWEQAAIASQKPMAK
jgi:arylsulfatase A-like enzyme